MNVPRGIHIDRKILYLPSDLSVTSAQANFDFIGDWFDADECQVVNKSSTAAGSVSHLDLANLAWTLKAIVPPPERFEKSFRNPCWYMHLRVPLKVNKILQTTRGNISDAEAYNLMNLVFGGSHHGVTSYNSSPETTRKSLVCIPMVHFIGFPRSGSTQLYKMLTSHPDLRGGTNKEPHWWSRYLFSSKFPRNILAVIRYLSHFSEASEQIAASNNTEQLLIDGSQSTVWDARTSCNFCAVPHLITSIVPNAKFIVLMRNPVDRLFSDFRYLCQEALRVKLKGRGSNRTEIEREQMLNEDPAFNVSADVFHEVVQHEIDSFHSCLGDSKNSLDTCTHLSTITTMPRKSHTPTSQLISSECSRVRLGISLYHVHLRRWLKVVPKERLLFLRTEDMSADPYSLLERVWKFLIVKDQSKAELTDILYRHLHSSLLGQGLNPTSVEGVRMHKETRNLLETFFQPHNTALSQLLGGSGFSIWNSTVDYR